MTKKGGTRPPEVEDSVDQTAREPLITESLQGVNAYHNKKNHVTVTNSIKAFHRVMAHDQVTGVVAGFWGLRHSLIVV